MEINKSTDKETAKQNKTPNSIKIYPEFIFIMLKAAGVIAKEIHSDKHSGWLF